MPCSRGQANVLGHRSPAFVLGLPTRSESGGPGGPPIRAGVRAARGPVSHDLRASKLGRGVRLQEAQRRGGLVPQPETQVAPVRVLSLVIDIGDVSRQVMPRQVLKQHALQPDSAGGPASRVAVLHGPALVKNRELVKLDGPLDLPGAVHAKAPHPLNGPGRHAAQGGVIFSGLEPAVRENRVPGHAGWMRCPAEPKYFRKGFEEGGEEGEEEADVD